MNKSFDDYLHLTSEAISFIEKRDVFKFEQSIIKRKELFEHLNENPNWKNSLSENQKKEIGMTEMILNDIAEKFYSEIKNDLKKVKTEKTLNKYESNSIFENVKNKINSSY